jgi:hypothetical protein
MGMTVIGMVSCMITIGITGAGVMTGSWTYAAFGAVFSLPSAFVMISGLSSLRSAYPRL